MPNCASVRTVAGCCVVLLSFSEACHIDDASAIRFPCSGSQIQTQPKVLCIWLKRCQRLKKAKKKSLECIRLYTKTTKWILSNTVSECFANHGRLPIIFLSQLLRPATPKQKKVTESSMQFLPKPTTKIKHFDCRTPPPAPPKICVIFERLIGFDW